MLNLKNTLDGYLKNVEVIGNTVQDTNNLADIRSVGDKVEGQELYKIELACYGENILKPDFEVGLWNTGNGTAQADSTAIRTKGFLRIRNQAHLVKRFDGKLGCQVILFDENFKYLGQQSYAGGSYVRYDNILPNAKYMKINFLNTTDLNLQCVLFDRVPSNINGVEFVEFQESELEILSPVQLEKVGDVADRIICKDGVWGVDKKVDAEVKNNVLVNTRTKSEFIALPHDQQVKLRTFAGQTNIAFLTEIPGQIKAQVPKSLGATVNTHTEQIAELHNSLERVKKLEETTVSTVETESNFTTVNATSNGYFEDVKLEGKTLVNLFDYSKLTSSSTLTVNGKKISVTGYSNRVYVPEVFTCNKTYTIKGSNYNKSNSDVYINQGKILLISKDSSISKTIDVIDFNKTDIATLTIPSDYNSANYHGLYFYGNAENTTSIENIIILEGDHANNPPEYFEGLMSVGQDVEEVSVESMSHNLFNPNESDFSTLYISGNSNGSMLASAGLRSVDFKCRPNTTYTISTKVYGNAFRVFASKQKPAQDVKGEMLYVANNITNITVNSGDNEYLLITYYSYNGTPDVSEQDVLDGLQIKLGELKPYTPHQSNKKPLLYYNPTTETWEKPILREWDTIEKHSDGKYYYHKRSGEVVLNGSENGWGVGTNSTNTLGFIITHRGVKQDGKLISTTLKKGSYYEDSENIHFATHNGIYIRALKSKLTTQDVAGFKAWLKDNPTTVVYELLQEEVYECTNIDLMTYSGETNYIINSGAISPKSTLKVHNNISNVIKILQEKVNLLENTFIAGLKSVLSGDMYSLATILYPEDFEQNDNTEQDIMVIPE